jgi:hypothetical protein
MHELILSPRCAACGAEFAAGDRFCRRCGVGVVAMNPAAPAIPRDVRLAPSSPVRSLLESRVAVVGILLVAGPLGLPLLWLSGRFSRPTKIITTVAYFGLTVVAPIAITWYWLDVAVRPLLDVWARKP